ncbi:hypothetical protein PR048_031464 [Dryococelus australis]|uniref:Uncharacterized protein n=1 Tax=Dryococelus australis TaxID=614101 RepID=A0ABQ9G9E1_9NEOP|nr:hypothetical protein PR048_031464 [Dryococelus australis]
MRRTDRFWMGVWSDLTIEQTLMQSMKSVGGLRRGRVSQKVFEQHEDLRESHKARYATDIAKVSLWFESRSPFPVTDEILSVATGVVGDNTITCYDTPAVGKQAMANMVGKHFTDLKLSRKDRALLLASMTCSVKMYDDRVVVDPFLIFQRMSISKQTDDDLKTYLQYELAPFPLAVFVEAGMWKTKNLPYMTYLKKEKRMSISTTLTFLWMGIHLHGQEVPHVRLFAKATSITSSNITLKSVGIHFGEDTEIILKQNHFLCNGNNKSRLISMLSVRFRDSGIECRIASDDADT